MGWFMTTAIYSLGRIFLAGIFLISGYHKATHFSETVERMAQAGIPFADLMAVGAIGMEMVGALMVATGYRARVGAILLILFLIPTTLIFHPPNVAGQLIQFFKNLAIMGGLLIVFGASGREEKE
jgi:putative oxidoreductase